MNDPYHILRLNYKNGSYFSCIISVNSAYYKDGSDLGPSVAHMYPILGQVPPPPPGYLTITGADSWLIPLDRNTGIFDKKSSAMSRFFSFKS